MTLLAVLTIDLMDVQPKVHRRITVPFNIRLDRLHLVIQEAMPWTNSHLYEMQIGECGWGEPDSDNDYDGPMSAKTATLAEALTDAGRRTFSYIYDFGDGWEHKVKLVKTAPAILGLPRIQLIEAIGRCPPEDSGGPWGYIEKLRILEDPSDEEYADVLEWMGEDYDPKIVNLPAIEIGLADLDGRWAPRKRKPPKPPS
jgi:hypothetical protein